MQMMENSEMGWRCAGLMNRTLTANIRQRRGSLVDIRVPLFVDENTKVPDGMKSDLSNGVPRGSSLSFRLHMLRMAYMSKQSIADIPAPAKPTGDTPYIHMDAMAFGMGCCCLQITFQAWNVDEARRVYDALVPVAPIMVRSCLSSERHLTENRRRG